MPQKQTHSSSASPSSSFPKLCSTSGSTGLGLTIDTTHVTCAQYRDEEGDTLVQDMKFLLGLEPAKTLEPNFVNRFLTTLFKLRRIPEINHDLLDRICKSANTLAQMSYTMDVQSLTSEVIYLLNQPSTHCLNPEFNERFYTALAKLRRIPGINHDVLDDICLRVDHVRDQELKKQMKKRANKSSMAKIQEYPKPAQRFISVPFIGRRNSIVL
ncbi:hypothetical protein BDR26DRAFT_1012346 [Obelidium mucronatum]|nr:hypothetical protein BDR26DRAFT_1012346 [Obelidium mucronatum]